MMIDAIAKTRVPKKYNPHERPVNLHYMVDMYECELGCLHNYYLARYPTLNYMLTKGQKELQRTNRCLTPQELALPDDMICSETGKPHFATLLMRYPFPWGLFFKRELRCMGCGILMTKAQASMVTTKELQSMYGVRI